MNNKVLETKNINGVNAEIVQNENETWIELNSVKLKNSFSVFSTPVYVVFKSLIKNISTGDYKVKNMNAGGCLLLLK